MSPIELPYEVEGRDYRGYLVDGSGGRRAPGVLLAHEAGGFTEHVLERARMMAEAGYVALAMDTFGEPVRDRAHAIALMTALTDEPERLRSRATGALEALRGLPNVDRGRIAAIGFCFGGTTVLELVRGGGEVACAVAFHAILETRAPARRGAVAARVLACVGAGDPLIPPAQRQAFVDEMGEADADWQMLLIGRAGHSFTNRAADAVGLPGFAYDGDADRLSWTSMLEFLRQSFARVGL